jgi:predicted metal-dependent phosphoesterase TrpH
MVIDMHNHTNISSPCSYLSPEELVETAKQSWLDAICVTEHSVIEGANLAQAVGRKMNYPVFRGVEARSDLGDMLVFGYYHDIPDGIRLEDLCSLVHGAGGVVFAAHPYRLGSPGLYPNMMAFGLDLEKQWDSLKSLHALDGVETINGNASVECNKKASLLATRLNKPGIGGSDAHFVHMIAKTATWFEKSIRTEDDLVEALKGRCFRPITL